jgi:hypothetical protein
MNWRLPTKEELNLMYENLHKKGIGGFAADYYWSSSGTDASNVWTQDFYDGHQYGCSKGNTLRVRAVRDFESEINFEIGEKTDTGIIFSNDGDKYLECALKDLKIGTEAKFTWPEAMDFFKRASEFLVAYRTVFRVRARDESDAIAKIPDGADLISITRVEN